VRLLSARAGSRSISNINFNKSKYLRNFKNIKSGKDRAMPVAPRLARQPAMAR
jgi:hypothetical protein